MFSPASISSSMKGVPFLRKTVPLVKMENMEHFAGLDVSVNKTSICIVDDSGRIVREAKVASEPDAQRCRRRRRTKFARPSKKSARKLGISKSQQESVI